MSGRGAAVLARGALAALLFGAGVAVGYALKPGNTVVEPDREIRPGRTGFTNPLYDCEVGSYPRGRELPPFKAELGDFVAKLIADGEATDVALYFRDLDNGPWVGLDEERAYRPASLLKVPLMMACLMQETHDAGFLRKKIVFEDVPDEGGVNGFVADVPLVRGRSYTVEELIEQVAVYSDNEAAVLLHGLVNKQILTRVYRDMGFDPQLASEPLLPTRVSPKSYGRLFRVLYNASYLDREMSEKLLSMMSRAEYRAALVAGVSPDTVVAHKFGVFVERSPGFTSVQLHDCGIVYSAQRPYFLCVMTHGTDAERLAGVIEQMSRFVSDVIAEPLPREPRHPSN